MFKGLNFDNMQCIPVVENPREIVDIDLFLSSKPIVVYCYS